MKGENSFHGDLKKLMNEFVFKVYKVTKSFPKEEVYGLTSQLRRAALSVILNYIEGYARQRTAVLRSFLEISYGSLKESKYLIYFSARQEYMDKNSEKELQELADKIGAMLWGTIKKIQ